MTIVPYTVGEQFVPLIAYGDAHLSDDELSSWNLLEEQVRLDAVQGEKFMHWDITDAYDEFAACEVTGLRGRCVTVNAVYVKTF